MNERTYNPWERLAASRKFWLLVMDTTISLVLHFVAVAKPEALEHVKFAILALQPVFVVIITSIAIEDAAASIGSKQ